MPFVSPRADDRSRLEARRSSRPEQAVVLAAGRGRRMGALTESLPKPLLEVDGRAILFHQLDALAAVGVERVVVVVGHLGDRIVDAVSARRDLRSAPDVVFARQARPLGTAHALAAAGPQLARDSPFLLLLGDLLVTAPVLTRLLDAYAAGADAVLAVDRQTDPALGAAVDVDEEGGVRGIVEKPPAGTRPLAWNNSGLYVLPGRAVELAAGVPLSPRGEHELPDVVLALLDEGLRVRAAEIRERLRHVGTPEDLTSG